MEFVQGRDLAYWLRRRSRFPTQLACECIRQAALGLQHAHEHGLVHRDIKPSNLLVAQRTHDDPPVVKILDMGLARFMSESADEGTLTRTGQIMGTPDHVSPEQAKDTKHADIRADIFSLGCTLFHLVSGHLPFQGDTLMAKLVARSSDDAPRLSSLLPDVPRELDALVARMLARNPAHRPQTPAEAAAALAVLAHAPGVAASAMAGPPASIGGPPTEPPSADSETALREFLKHLESAPVQETVDYRSPATVALGLQREGAVAPGRPAATSPGRKMTMAATGIAATLILCIGLVFAFRGHKPQTTPKQASAQTGRADARKTKPSRGSSDRAAPSTDFGQDAPSADQAPTESRPADSEDAAATPKSEAAAATAAPADAAVPINPDPVALAESLAAEKQRCVDAEFAAAMEPVEALVATWDFAAAETALDDVQLEGDDFLARLQLRRDELDFDSRLKPTSPCKGKASDGGDVGFRFTPEITEVWNKALELRRQGVVKF